MNKIFIILLSFSFVLGQHFNRKIDESTSNSYYSSTTLSKELSSIISISTLAGSGVSGSTDGTGTAASFGYIEGVSIDSKGNIFVAGVGNNLIRKITPEGVVTTFAGSGSAGSDDGTGTAASFYRPGYMAIDSLDNIYLTDTGNNLIRKITSEGVVTTFAGSGSAGSDDGTGIAASFNNPWGIAIDTINLSQSNLTSLYDLEWTVSNDVDGDSINYLLFAKVGVYEEDEIWDTTSTKVQISYSEILEGVFEGQPINAATVKFIVKSTDGIDTVNVTGDDRVLYVSRYEYLSTESDLLPTEYALHENFPNPFNPSTTLRFDLPYAGDVSLTIYNMLGQKVKSFDMRGIQAGKHTLKWNATNDLGEKVGTGVYLYQLQTRDFMKTRKMIFMK